MLGEMIKKDFSIFESYEGRSFVYFDTAATSQTPQMVLDAMDAYYTKFRANIHRGLYEAGEDASRAYENVRTKVARFIGAEPREVIFTAGATASSNMLVSMLEYSGMIKEGDEIATTAMEHHASL
ncbi:MAG: aminotransferase class V-fold PLP-dependent enzyme, partial [Minisyncoccota bacterium]